MYVGDVFTDRCLGTPTQADNSLMTASANSIPHSRSFGRMLTVTEVIMSHLGTVSPQRHFEQLQREGWWVCGPYPAAFSRTERPGVHCCASTVKKISSSYFPERRKPAWKHDWPGIIDPEKSQSPSVDLSPDRVDKTSLVAWKIGHPAGD